MNAPDDALAELAAAEADAEEDAEALADEADALELLEDDEQPAITNAAKANAATNAAKNLNFLISSLPSFFVESGLHVSLAVLRPTCFITIKRWRVYHRKGRLFRTYFEYARLEIVQLGGVDFVRQRNRALPANILAQATLNAVGC